jgi:hypothetical protein
MNKGNRLEVNVQAPATNALAPLSDEDVDAIDGCYLEIVDETLDEELPPTEGGVA